jgi:hypothetical protein
MPKVKYIEKGGSGASIMRWRFLPDGRVLDPHGQVKAQVPDDVAYSPAAKRMADRGILDIEGYVVPKKKEAAPSPVVTSVKEEEPKTAEKPKKKTGK